MLIGWLSDLICIWFTTKILLLNFLKQPWGLIQSVTLDLASQLFQLQTDTDPEVWNDSPVRPGASVAHVPVYSCSCGPCWLSCQGDLMYEDPEANIHIHMDRESSRGWMGVLGIVLLQLYYNGNSAFLTNPAALVISPRDQTIILGNCFCRTNQTKWSIKKAGIDLCLNLRDITDFTC